MSAVLPSVGTASTPEPSAKPTSATDRLVASRNRLRGALVDIANPPKHASPLGANVDAMARGWLRKARALPGAALVVDSLDGWWRQHPLRTAGVVAVAASRRLMRPVAERNPHKLMLGAAAIGALLMFSRPWRWLVRPALFMGLLPQLTRQVLRRMPVETWVQMAARLLPRNGPVPAQKSVQSRTADLP